jgi:hypothetical protein
MPRSRRCSLVSTLVCCAFLLAIGCESLGDITGLETPDSVDGGPTPDDSPSDDVPPVPDEPDAAPGEDVDAAPSLPDEPDADVPEPPPLAECQGTPSIDRLTQWLATTEGQMIPPGGSILVPDGDEFAGRVEFVGGDWHVLVMWIENQFEAQENLSASAGFTMTYSAENDLWVQMRPGAHWSGGDKYVTLVPGTGGQLETRFFSFAASSWTTLAALGTPAYPYSEALADVRGFVFVDDTPNQLVFTGFRIDGFTPPCP